MRARIRDTEIYFDIEGAGLVPDGARMREKPPAFVIHGGPGADHSDSKGPLGPLADKLQLVFFDHRGQGRSARGDVAKYVLDENVEDMEALRLHLGLGPIVSIGTSYGGMVAMAHAARYPASVSHLVLVVTASHAGFNARAREIVAERGTPEQKAVCGELWEGKLDSVEKLRHFFDVMGPLYSLRYDPVAAKLSRGRGILAPDALNRAFAPGGFLQSYDLRPELSAITAPTLILAGRHDWICPPEFSQEIHRLIPGSDLRIFEESSHSIRNDEPEKLRDAIAGFVVYKARPGRG
ncbi:proline iminopeptidase [Rhizobiales bacterium GAS191]|nr:proline iminopeptidase [Rhizobiales bacterium GAS191]